MDRLDRMVKLVNAEIPGFRIVQKRDVWWMRALGVVLRPINDTFMTEYTTVIGRTVYLPCPLAEFPRDALARTLAHELVHMVDMRDHGLGFYISYLFTPIPLWRTHRAYWERRGYGVDLMLAFHDGGEGRLVAVETRLRRVFAGPAYGWMWGGRSAAARYLRPTVDAVRAGTLQTAFPYDRILRAWSGLEDAAGP